MSGLMLYSAFDASSVQFSAPEKNKFGGVTVPLFVACPDGSRRRVSIQTPAVITQFGLSAYENKDTGDITNYSIDINFKNAESDPKVADFLQRMKKLDEALLKASVSKSQDWFGEKRSKEILAAFMRPIVQDTRKDATGKPYPPSMKTKVPMRENKTPNVPVFDENRTPVDPEYVTKGSVVKLILELNSVWIVSKKSFGLTWRVMQVSVVSRPTFGGFQFLEDDDNQEGNQANAMLEG